MLSSLVVLSTFVFVFQTASIKETVETVALPVTNKVIVLDARAPENQMNGIAY